MDMTPEEQRAFEWALNQQYQSVSARYARILALYIQRAVDPYTSERADSAMFSAAQHRVQPTSGGRGKDKGQVVAATRG